MLSTDLSSPTGAFSFPKWSLLFWHHVVCEPNNFIAHMHMHTYRYGACKEMFNRRSWSWACERNVSHLSCSGQQAETMAKFETQRCGKVAIQLDRVSVNNINRCLLHSEKALEEKELNVSINRYSFCSCVSYSCLFFVNIIDNVDNTERGSTSCRYLTNPSDWSADKLPPICTLFTSLIVLLLLRWNSLAGTRGKREKSHLTLPHSPQVTCNQIRLIWSAAGQRPLTC